jgi:dTDP-4-dehydrorhamnose reductase
MPGMRLLVTGAAGMLGHDLLAAAAAAGHDAVGIDLEVDITDPAAIAAKVREVGPAAVVNGAAWTDVDGAESAEARAAAVNGAGAGNVAAAAAAVGAFLVHVSTDFVFDGEATEPYLEDAEPSPISAYGRTKLAGEEAVRAAAPGAFAIVRSAWLFGVHGKNFVDTMLKLAADRDEVTVVDDQVGCPTFTGHLAPALLDVAERRAGGVLHVAGGGRCSWYDLAVATFERTGTECRVRRGGSADLGRPAPRPAFSVLGSSRPDAPRLPSWETGLDAYLQAREARLAGGRRG